MEDGMVQIPNGPGLGIEVNREVLRQYAVPHWDRNLPTTLEETRVENLDLQKSKLAKIPYKSAVYKN